MDTQQRHISLLERQTRDMKEFGLQRIKEDKKKKPLLIPVMSSMAVPCLFCGNKHASETCKRYKTPIMREIRLIVLNRCTRCLHQGHTKNLSEVSTDVPTAEPLITRCYAAKRLRIQKLQRKWFLLAKRHNDSLIR